MVSARLTFVISILLLTVQFVNGLPQQFKRAGDLEILERRDLVRRAAVASPCSKLDLDDAQSLPGWAQLEQYARSKWGEGDWTITINPAGVSTSTYPSSMPVMTPICGILQYKDKPATMCVADPVKIEMTGDSKCNETRKDIPPVKKDSNQIKVNEGYTNTGNWNITNVTTAAHAEFFSGNFQLPNITKLHLDSLTAVGKFINAPDNSFVTTISNVTYKNTELTPVPDKHCIGTVLEQECITPAKGRIQLVATGYIWFNYKTKACNTFSLRLVTFSFALTCRGHLSLTPKEANILNVGTIYFMRSTSLLISGIVTDTVKIEDVLKNETDRSAWIDFNGYMNTTWRYDYFDECRWNFKLQ
ncbi:hypothetical protein CVT25_010755 [Psilocybe cyanescens]|uniref:Uncharacterized protein n=1 Tax=Psilocybe cyanescens TaxID=93625 RepID=A0A409WJT8_PSICY|nr:hypothetical protein CVT25_010755 [Psilocybe cyanescens]